MTAWLTSFEAAAYAGVSIHTVWKHAEAGRLSGVKTTPGSTRSQWRFRPVDVDRWLEAGRVTA